MVGECPLLAVTDWGREKFLEQASPSKPPPATEGDGQVKLRGMPTLALCALLSFSYLSASAYQCCVQLASVALWEGEKVGVDLSVCIQGSLLCFHLLSLVAKSPGNIASLF